MKLSLNVVNTKPVLGSFSKGCDGSVSLNFGRSGGANCDRACRHHPQSTAADPTHACYAVRVELRGDRKALALKLDRHENTDPAALCRRALLELQMIAESGVSVPWFRFSTNGSLPMPQDTTPEFERAFVQLLDYLDANNIPVHLPVESEAKREFYQGLAGTRCTVRLSAQTDEEFISAPVASSAVAGTQDESRLERLVSARLLAKARHEQTGRTCAVCPAVASRYVKGSTQDNTKCGNCTLCSQADVDVVFPLH